MSDTTASDDAYTGWAIVELMGHRQTAGRVAQVQMYGATMLRVDTPEPGGETIATQMYGGSAIYCVTPCTEAVATRALREAYNLPPMVALALREREPKPAPAQIEAPLMIEEEPVAEAPARGTDRCVCGKSPSGMCDDVEDCLIPF